VWEQAFASRASAAVLRVAEVLAAHERTAQRIAQQMQKAGVELQCLTASFVSPVNFQSCSQTTTSGVANTAAHYLFCRQAHR
jgi:hypothetical protein